MSPRPRTDHARVMRLTTCPGCDAVAEVLDAGTVHSTDGPVQLVRVQCVRRHWFLMPDSLGDEPTLNPSPSNQATSS